MTNILLSNTWKTENLRFQNWRSGVPKLFSRQAATVFTTET